MPIKLVVVCEAKADYSTATQLAERIFQEKIDWIDADLLRNCPLWHGRDLSTPYLRWTEIGKILRTMGLPKPVGRLGNDPLAPDADQARTALIVLQRLHPDLDGVLLLRDEDREARKKGLEQARNASSLSERIVIGLAKSERECWVLAGFSPQGDEETRRLETERQQLGFDPCLNAERLDARRDHHKRSAKRVLGHLTDADPDREARCWLETPLPTLRQRGERSGLNEYLDEIANRFVPLFQVKGNRDD
jgi:hypothetical protein